MTDGELRASYEATPYISLPVPLSHPDHLFALGRLHGLEPAPPEGARVLELGCAAGGNLLPMAAALPDAAFAGVDLSARQVADARAAAGALGLANVALIEGDVTTLTAADNGSFDYIIAHGLYSWVPPAVQQRLLPLLGELLAPHGIAYVSYNCYPGWHQRQVIRALMQQHVAGQADPAARAHQARAILGVLAATYDRDDAYGRMLCEERDNVAALDDSFVLHDLLEAENHPLWFAEFARRCAAAGLQYLSEANLAATRPESFGADVRDVLQAHGDTVAREQLIDFWLNRSFRETLVVPAAAPLRRALVPAAVDACNLASPLQPEQPALAANDSEAFFVAPDGGRCGLTEPGAQRALAALGQAWPRALPFAALAEIAGAAELVRGLALDLLLRNWLELRPRPDGFTLEPGRQPRASALARQQLRDGDRVTNLRHRAIRIDDPTARLLLSRLDGARDRAELVAGLQRQQEAGLLPAPSGGADAAYAQALAQLARSALLVA